MDVSVNETALRVPPMFPCVGIMQGATEWCQHAPTTPGAGNLHLLRAFGLLKNNLVFVHKCSLVHK